MALYYRRNINCLTANQLHKLRSALNTMFALPAADKHSYERIAGLHGSPAPSYCRHGSPGFLTWHRAYMEAYEEALRCIDSSLTLPFWDWSSGPSTGVPAACRQPTYVNPSGNTVSNPLYSGPLPASLGGGQTARRANIDTTSFDDLATSAQSAMGSGTFASFQNALNGPHGGVHGRTGGQMSSVSTAGFDPIFYLHHCNVDRLWWKWQRSHPGALPANEASLALEPFNKPYSSAWRTGSEFLSTEAHGYAYARFCFFVPPFVIREPILVAIEPDWIRRLDTARLVLKRDAMEARSMELRVFVNQPSATARTGCLDNPHFAGAFHFFGMDMEMKSAAEQPGESSFDLELDIAESLRNVGDDADEVTLTLVPVGADAKPVRAKEIKARGLELILD